MKIALSSCDVRAYRKGTGTLALHLSTVLLFDAGWAFDTSHIKGLAVSVLLPNGVKMEFSGVKVYVDAEFTFDGKTNAIAINLEEVTKYRRLEPSVVTVVVECWLDFGGTMPHLISKQMGVLRMMN